MQFAGMRRIALARSAPILLTVSLALTTLTGVSAQNVSDVDAVKQVSRDMGDAMVAGDIRRLGEIYADDAQVIGISGKLVTKEDILRNIQSGRHDLKAYELGPIDVQVFGNFAVAHGGVLEKRSWDGKDDSGQFVWMDLLEKRAGKWVVIRSAAAKVK